MSKVRTQSASAVAMSITGSGALRESEELRGIAAHDEVVGDVGADLAFDVGHCADFAVALAFALSIRPDVYRETSITLVALLAERTQTEVEDDGPSEVVKVCLHVFVKAQHVNGTIYYLDVAGKHDPEEAWSAREARWRECVEQRDHEEVMLDPFILEFAHRDDLWRTLRDYGCAPDSTHRELAYLFIQAHSKRYF